MKAPGKVPPVQLALFPPDAEETLWHLRNARMKLQDDLDRARRTNDQESVTSLLKRIWALEGEEYRVARESK